MKRTLIYASSFMNSTRTYFKSNHETFRDHVKFRELRIYISYRYTHLAKEIEFIACASRTFVFDCHKTMMICSMHVCCTLWAGSFHRAFWTCLFVERGDSLIGGVAVVCWEHNRHSRYHRHCYNTIRLTPIQPITQHYWDVLHDTLTSTCI